MKKQLLTLLSAFSLSVGLNAQTTVTLGAGTATAGASANTTPISRYYENTHFQVVYTAAELTAQGAVAGNITKIGWYVEVASAGLPAYTIKMANTTATNSANYNATSTSIVYGPTTYNPVAGGFNLLTLATPMFPVVNGVPPSVKST